MVDMQTCRNSFFFYIFYIVPAEQGSSCWSKSTPGWSPQTPNEWQVRAAFTYLLALNGFWRWVQWVFIDGLCNKNKKIKTNKNNYMLFWRKKIPQVIRKAPRLLIKNLWAQSFSQYVTKECKSEYIYRRSKKTLNHFWSRTIISVFFKLFLSGKQKII